jgi:hypothetical protein
MLETKGELMPENSGGGWYRWAYRSQDEMVELHAQVGLELEKTVMIPFRVIKAICGPILINESGVPAPGVNDVPR